MTERSPYCTFSYMRDTGDLVLLGYEYTLTEDQNICASLPKYLRYSAELEGLFIMPFRSGELRTALEEWRKLGADIFSGLSSWPPMKVDP